ncbi:unnamed protein product [Adineta ricciae]|uniref:Uncharacterized protein n=1 Tax=Adineta ricciae TaxID=249248 RepID=A0A815VWN2_ADIRI|nr:unnamed protein product [Adineta ricciae]
MGHISQLLSFGLLILAVVIYSCPLESNVKTYLILSGVVEITWPFLFILVIFCCKEEDFATTITTYQHWIRHPGEAWQKNGTTQEKSRGIGTLTLYAALICLLISFVLWCCGNAWITANYKHIEYYNTTSFNYCDPQLFTGAFAVIITANIDICLFAISIVAYYLSK